MRVVEQIASHLQQLSPEHLRLDDISYQHAAGAEAQSHFYLELVSAEFSGKSLLARQRLVHACLQPLAGSYHALATRLYTPDEWVKLGQQSISPAPECAHKRG